MWISCSEKEPLRWNSNDWGQGPALEGTANSALLKVIQKDQTFFSKYTEGVAVHIALLQEHSMYSTPLQKSLSKDPSWAVLQPRERNRGSSSCSGWHGQHLGNPSYTSSLKLILMLFPEPQTW